MNLSENEKLEIRCALADLIGSWERGFDFVRGSIVKLYVTFRCYDDKMDEYEKEVMMAIESILEDGAGKELEVDDVTVDDVRNAYLKRTPPGKHSSIAQLVREVDIMDPDTMLDVGVSIYKDSASGAMLGIDTSFITGMFDDDEDVEIPDVFDGFPNTIFLREDNDIAQEAS